MILLYKLQVRAHILSCLGVILVQYFGRVLMEEKTRGEETRQREGKIGGMRSTKGRRQKR